MLVSGLIMVDDAPCQKIGQLEEMARTLESLAACCQGDDRPDCPILDNLAGGPGCCG